MILEKAYRRIYNSIEDKWFHILVRIYNGIVRKQKLRSFKQNLTNNLPQTNYKTYNSSAKRLVEIKQTDIEMENVILTCYFTKKVDPQFNIIRIKPDINYISPWYSSIVKHKLNGVIIHDGLDKEFIEEYQNEYVQFREYLSGNYSIFEERWFAYYEFVRQTKIKHFFLTDINDVYITRNPFSFAASSNVLYIGRDRPNKIRHSLWMLDELNNFVRDSRYKVPPTYYFQPVYNAGVVGGSREIVLFFISRIINLCLLTKTDCHKDMTLINLVIHKNFSIKLSYHVNEAKEVDAQNDEIASNEFLRSGYPLNSLFQKYELNSDAFFIHK